MNDLQLLLINKIAHEVKNELTTLHLTLFNLTHFLNSIVSSGESERQIKQFIYIMNTALDKSFETVSYLLSLSHFDKKLFKEIDIFQVLREEIIWHKEYYLFKVNLPTVPTLVKSDSNLVQLFFHLFLDLLIEYHSERSKEICVKGLDEGKKRIVFSGSFSFNDRLLFQTFGKNFRINSVSIQYLMLRELAEHLQISVDWNRKNESEITEIILKFNH